MRNEDEIRQRLTSNEAWLNKFKQDLKDLDPDEPLYYLTQECINSCKNTIRQMKWVLMEDNNVWDI